MDKSGGHGGGGWAEDDTFDRGVHELYRVRLQIMAD